MISGSDMIRPGVLSHRLAVVALALTPFLLLALLVRLPNKLAVSTLREWEQNPDRRHLAVRSEPGSGVTAHILRRLRRDEQTRLFAVRGQWFGTGGTPKPMMLPSTEVVADVPMLIEYRISARTAATGGRTTWVWFLDRQLVVRRPLLVAGVMLPLLPLFVARPLRREAFTMLAWPLVRLGIVRECAVGFEPVIR